MEWRDYAREAEHLWLCLKRPLLKDCFSFKPFVCCECTFQISMCFTFTTWLSEENIIILIFRLQGAFIYLGNIVISSKVLSALDFIITSLVIYILNRRTSLPHGAKKVSSSKLVNYLLLLWSNKHRFYLNNSCSPIKQQQMRPLKICSYNLINFDNSLVILTYKTN